VKYISDIITITVLRYIGINVSLTYIPHILVRRILSYYNHTYKFGYRGDRFRCFYRDSQKDKYSR